MGRRKKVGTAGKFGPRYGRKIRLRVAEIESAQRARYACTRCGAVRVRRLAAGIWTCQKCGAKFAGGAWRPAEV